MANEKDKELQNPLELSDEEVMEAPEPDFSAFDDDTAEEEVEAPEQEEIEEPEEEELKEEENTEPEPPVSEEESEEEEPEDIDDEQEDEIEEEDEDASSDSKSSKETGIDYASEGKKILAPFKANGRDVQVQDANQAIRLMQMGAGYNEKMIGLKPSLKILKMLENNSLLDESKISYLIELDKKSPEAITKLIQDSGIDPLDVNVDEKTNYSPKSHAVDEKQVNLDLVLDEIQSTDAYSTTVDIIGNRWDEASKTTLYENPDVIQTINEQVANGVYQQIDDMVKQQRMLGNIKPGMSDIEAYRAVGIYMQQNNLFKGQVQAPTENTVENVSLPSKTTNQNPKLKKRRRAAGSTKSIPTATKKRFNPLSLSDEDFEKAAKPQI